MKVKGVVIEDKDSFKNKWFGVLKVKISDDIVELPCAGIVSQWLKKEEEVEIELEDPEDLNFNNYQLWRFYEKDRIKVWPVYSTYEEISVSVNGKTIYSYKLRIREAVRKSDFEQILELEQYHYASKKETLGIWKCDKCSYYILSNLKPVCNICGSDKDMQIFQIKGSLPTSRFLILELSSREKYEPEVLGYVRVDTPVPRMHRLLSDGRLIRDIREKVFPKDWFSPLFYFEKKGFNYFDQIRKKAIEETNTSVSRISRVVIHPDYRTDGLGKVAVKCAIGWILERRVPEMKRKKELVEVIAQMAKFNPFFEKVGFKYLWDTGSGKPALYYPLTKKAESIISSFLKKDPYGSKHKGKLYKPLFKKVEPISSSIVFKNVTKYFENTLNLDGLNQKLKELLEDFGVSERKIQRKVISNLNLKIDPKTITVLIGASGAGKTTLLRLVIGSSLGLDNDKFLPTEGNVIVPENTKLSVLIPNEFEPEFGEESIIEHIYNKTRNEITAVEILNICGISDAVLYRARFSELSTGQKERVKIASLISNFPNLLIIDEFGSHLDLLSAMRICRRVVSLIRDLGITFIMSTHRSELLKVISPDKILYVGYGKVKEDVDF